MHYYKRNIGDYAKKAGRLSMLEHGAYTLLIDACYDRERFPTEGEAIEWCWARSQSEIDAVLFVLSRFFTLQDGAWVQNRIAEEVLTYKKNSTTNSRIATEREEKRRSRARTVHEDGTNKHEPPPNQEPRTINQEPLTKNTKRSRAILASRPDDVDEPVWNDFQAIRKAKRAPLTDTALETFRKEAQKAGVTLAGALSECCARGWQGFKAEWLQRPKNLATQNSLESFSERDERMAKERVHAFAGETCDGIIEQSLERIDV